MHHSARFIFTVDSEKEAAIIVDSLLPEITHKIPKTHARVTYSGNTFILEVKAKDVSSLRAACNSYLRWITTAQSVKESI
jgi:tRNA threonylcarbamoyladenosine modification (KEOPS) complex  Pcc1 subunit